MSASIPTISKEKFLEMTGTELMDFLNIERYNTDYQFRTPEGQVITTWLSWSNRYGRSYIHLTRPIKLRIVNPDGSDTGLPSVDDIFHLRGKTSAKLSDLQEV